MSIRDSPTADDSDADPSLEEEYEYVEEENEEEVEEEVEEEEEEEVEVDEEGEEVEEEGEEEEEEEVEEEEEEVEVEEEEVEEEVEEVEEVEEEVEEVEEVEEEVEEEEEEVVEEEEEEEVEEAEEEEENEEAVEMEVEEDKRAVPDSLSDANKHSKDSNQHMESEGKEENLAPVSPMAENPEVMAQSSMNCMEENDVMLKACVSLRETLTVRNEEVQPKCEISSQHMESEGQEENLGPFFAMAENLEVMVQSSMHCLEVSDAMLKASVPSRETPTVEKEEFLQKNEVSSHPKSTENLNFAEDSKSQRLDVDVLKIVGGCSEPGSNSKADLHAVDDTDPRATRLSSDTGNDVTTGLSGVPPRDSVAEGGQSSRNKMQAEMESRNDGKQMISRTRSQSPSAEIKDGNKRPAIICAFFAKGWCIRGSSCSFLHVKDTVNNTDPEAQGDSVTAHQKRALKVEEGVGGDVERPRMNEQEASPSWHSYQEKQRFLSRDNLLLESGSFNAPNSYFRSNLSSYSTHAEGIDTVRNQHLYRGYNSVFSHSPNSSLVTQFPTTGMSISHQILPRSGSSGATTLDSRKLLNCNKEYHALKFTFSGSEREGFPVSSSRVPPHSTGYKSKLCSYEWEPSVPFRPSFFITSMNVSSPGDLYDPLRDSIEIPNIGDGSLKASLLVQGSSIQATSQVQTYGGSAVAAKPISDVNDDKSSVSSHNRLPDKSSIPREKDCLATETEITSATYVNSQNGKKRMGQHAFGTEDKGGKELTEHNARHHGDGSGHKKDRKDRDNRSHEIDGELHMDGGVQKETKALRNFRAVLVDQVKELLKPSWHEGRLSKDAYVTIVKKSVDKVVSTLEPHQVPTTIDTAKQYVSSCRVKIAKLVNGYVNKYGKS